MVDAPEVSRRPPDAKREILRILDEGYLELWDHAVEELGKDSLDMNDVRNILRAGVVREPELVAGEWRYRVETPRMAVVVFFRADEPELVIVTGWRVRT